MEIPIINNIYDVYKIAIDININLPKRWRYTLGASAEKSILDLLDVCIMAKYAPSPLKATYLLKAQSYLESTRLKFRLMLEQKIANETKIFQVQAKLLLIGKMIGGWTRSLSL
ncbi:MAG: four helix bundle protein [bacterium]|nr:four helix bundle protein [bacterium]